MDRCEDLSKSTSSAPDLSSPRQAQTPQASKQINPTWPAVNSTRALCPEDYSDDEFYVDESGCRHVETDNGADEVYLINAAEDSFAGILESELTEAELAALDAAEARREAEQKLARIHEQQLERWNELLRVRATLGMQQPQPQLAWPEDKRQSLSKDILVYDLIRRIVKRLHGKLQMRTV